MLKIGNVEGALYPLDGNILGVKHHKSGGKFKIAEDSKGGIYVNRIVDAGDILQVEK